MNVGEQINDLIVSERWEQARALIKQELEKEPDSHWLLTQLAETYYEQRKYKKALALLLKSREIVPDCPLTLWHLAGTLDALAYHLGALRLYTWLLQSQKTSEDDPCWESAEWTDALKTDCVYRIGVCYRNLKRKEMAESCFRRYVDLLLAGAAGSYPIGDVITDLQDVRRSTRNGVEAALRETANWLVQASGESSTETKPPKLDQKRLRQLQDA